MNFSELQVSLLHAAASTLNILENISLADKNWFGTGGSARYFVEPITAAEFVEALEFARQQDLSIFVLGEGANILISDQGFNGLVIRPKLKEILSQDLSHDEVLVTAGSGVSFGDLITWCLDRQILGLEEFSGIPGTVGGSVFINIHYFKALLSHFLVSATVINKSTGKLSTVDKEWFKFGYDFSALHDGNHYLVDATFKLKKVDALTAAYARGRSDETIRHRVARYPYKGTCGSFFRNFHDHEVTVVSNGKKMIFVAYYLDKLGVKGALKIGGAGVSYQHANMLVNDGTATSSDLIAVAKTMQEMVLKEFGIIPQPECILVGFTENPLL